MNSHQEKQLEIFLKQNQRPIPPASQAEYSNILSKIQNYEKSYSASSPWQKWKLALASLALLVVLSLVAFWRWTPSQPIAVSSGVKNYISETLLAVYQPQDEEDFDEAWLLLTQQEKI